MKIKFTILVAIFTASIIILTGVVFSQTAKGTELTCDEMATFVYEVAKARDQGAEFKTVVDAIIANTPDSEEDRGAELFGLTKVVYMHPEESPITLRRNAAKACIIINQ